MINRETINDRGKLLYHRLVARELARRPELIDKVRPVVAGWVEEEGDHPSLGHGWAAVLRQERDELRRMLTARSAAMTRLRANSPFTFVQEFVLQDERKRKKLWRIAAKTKPHHAFSIVPTSTMPREPWPSISRQTPS